MYHTKFVTPLRRALASGYHTGQWSELYKVSSSGMYSSFFALCSELDDAIKIGIPEDANELAEWYKELVTFIETCCKDTD